MSTLLQFMNDHAEDFASPYGHRNAVISFSEHDDNDDDDDAEELFTADNIIETQST